MTPPAKPRRHFIAWSPNRERAFYAITEREARFRAREYEWDVGMKHRPTWRHVSEELGWRVTEVSE